MNGILKDLAFGLFSFLAGTSSGQELEPPTSTFYFDSTGASRQTLENYLERAITMVYLLIPDRPEGGREYALHSDDVRMVKDIGAKFIGRATYRWGDESRLNRPDFWDQAKLILDDLHGFDPEMLLQGCLFEIVTTELNSVPIPLWVSDDFNLPAEQKNFSYPLMLNDGGIFVDHWGKGKSVPDISKLETKLWFYFLASSYMGIGVEAFHLGQVELIGMNDPERLHWESLIKKIRLKVKQQARRGWVIMDALIPKGEFIKDGVSLIDFKSFPLRIKEVVDEPNKDILEVGHLDRANSKSDDCPSGYSQENTIKKRWRSDTYMSLKIQRDLGKLGTALS